MDIKDSYLHGTVGVVKSISVDADKLKYKLADIAGTVREVTLPIATTSANGLMSSGDKTKLDNLSSTIGNYVTLNTDQEITGTKTFTKQLKFTVAKDTAPFLVTSDTKVTNLNADLVDGIHSTGFIRQLLLSNTDPTTFLQNIWKYKGEHLVSIRNNDWNTLTGRNDLSWGAGLMYIQNNITSTSSTIGGGLLINLLGDGYLLTCRGNTSSSSIKADKIVTESNLSTYNVGTADKLKTSRKLWGLDFDGSANVSGDMTGVGSINNVFTVSTDGNGVAHLKIHEVTTTLLNYIHLYVTSNTNNGINTRPLVIQKDYGNVGVGLTNPSEKLHVSGNVKATSFLGNLDGTYVNKLTGYSKATSTSDLAATDTLNTALGKLEYKADTAYSWYRTITDDDTDDIINKWDEVVDFVNGLEVDLTDEFVTRKTDLTIIGKKIFSHNAYGEQLTIHRTLNNSDSMIKFSNTGNGLLGYIGIGGSDSESCPLNPYWSNGTNAYKFWHSGNDGSESGLDADLLDGKHASEFALNANLANYVQIVHLKETSDKLLSNRINCVGQSNKGDLSALTENPTGYGSYISIAYSGKGSASQLYLDTSSSNSGIYYRTRQAGTSTTYRDWRKVLDENNYGLYALPLAGGNMTGNINFPTGKGINTGANYNYTILAETSVGSNVAGASDIAASVFGTNNTPSIIRSSGNLYHYHNTAKTRYRIWDEGNLTPTEILTQLKTVDGSASGLDADLLDGSEGSFYKNRYTYSIAKGKYLKIVAGDPSQLIISGSMSLGRSALLCYYSVYGTGTEERTRFKYIYYSSEYKVFVNNASGKRELYIYNNASSELTASINISALNTNIPSCEIVDTLPASYVEYNNSYALASLSILDKYLKLSGGTMTGPITLTSGGASSFNKTALSFISQTGTEQARIGTNSSNHFGIYSIGTIYLKPDSSFTANGPGVALSSTVFTYNNYNVLHEGNISNYLGYIGTTQVQSSALVLSLTGIDNATMTGTTSTRKLVISSTEPEAHISFTRTTINYIAIPSKVTFLFGGKECSEANSTLVMTSSGLYPGTTNVGTIGTSSKIWNNVYATYGNYSTQITVPTIYSGANVLSLQSSTSIYLQAHNQNASSLVLGKEYFKPFNDGHTKIDLGLDTARWKGLYCVTGDFTGDVTLRVADKNVGSPKLIFERNGPDNAYYDWLQYVGSGHMIFTSNSTGTHEERVRFVDGGGILIKGKEVLHAGNYSNYLPFLNSTTTHATNTSVIYAPSTAGTKGLILTSNGSGAPVWSSIPSLKNPYAIKFKKPDGTNVSYDGSSEVDLTAGIRFAKSTHCLASSSSNITTTPDTGMIIYSIMLSEDRGNLPGVANANGVITINTHRGNYNHLLGFSSSGFYYRYFLATQLNETKLWNSIIHEGNYTDFTVKKDGTGAEGTWEISITGNAGSASTSAKLSATEIITTKEFSLSNASWTNTGYTFASLATGTYAIQVTSGSNLVASGIMSVYKNLEDSAGDEIPLHVYSNAGWRPYLRTYANKLLISSNDATALPRKVTIKIALIL